MVLMVSGLWPGVGNSRELKYDTRWSSWEASLKSPYEKSKQGKSETQKAMDYISTSLWSQLKKLIKQDHNLG